MPLLGPFEEGRADSDSTSQATCLHLVGPSINRVGIANAGSSALFTGLAPGEFVLICGTSLTSATLFDPSFPNHPGQHKVLVNHAAAPIYGVAHRARSLVRSRCTLPTTARCQTRYLIFDFLKSQPDIFNGYTAIPAFFHHADSTP